MKEKLLKALKWFFNSYIWLGLLLLIADIISKNLIVINQDTLPVDLIPNFLRINYTVNSNVVFGWDIFKNPLTNRIIFIVVALAVTIGIIVYLALKWGKVNRYYKACFFMVIAGALGNAIDRIFYTPEYLNNSVNGVVDWIDFYGIWGFNFNIADCAVVIAMFMLIIYVIVTEIMAYVKKKKLEPKTEEDTAKVVSKTEQEKNEYLEEKETKDE